MWPRIGSRMQANVAAAHSDGAHRPRPLRRVRDTLLGQRAHGRSTPSAARRAPHPSAISGMVWRFAAPLSRPHRRAPRSRLLVAAAGDARHSLRLQAGHRPRLRRGGGDPAISRRWFDYLLVMVVVLAMATAIRFYFVSWLGERVGRRHPPRGAAQSAAPVARASSRRTARPRSPRGSPSTRRSSSRSSAPPSRSRCATSVMGIGGCIVSCSRSRPSSPA